MRQFFRVVHVLALVRVGCTFVFSGDLVFSISFAGVSVRVLVISLVLGMVFRGNLDQWQPRGVGNDIGAGWSQARLRGDSACLPGQLALSRRFFPYKLVIRPPFLKPGRFFDWAASAGESP